MIGRRALLGLAFAGLASPGLACSPGAFRPREECRRRRRAFDAALAVVFVNVTHRENGPGGLSWTATCEVIRSLKGERQEGESFVLVDGTNPIEEMGCSVRTHLSEGQQYVVSLYPPDSEFGDWVAATPEDYIADMLECRWAL